MDAVKLMIDEVMALCLHTLENGQADLCTMVRRRLVCYIVRVTLHP